MTVIDVGCAMGFFSLPMAEMVESEGRVICIDLQEKMVQKLFRRAKKRDLHNRIEVRVCREDRLNVDDLEDVADFILASSVVHEVPDNISFFTELHKVAKEGGKLLVIEPAGHASNQRFACTEDAAEKCGFTLVDNHTSRKKLTALFRKDSTE